MAIVDPENPYRYLEVRGTVVEITETSSMLTTATSDVATTVQKDLLQELPYSSSEAQIGVFRCLGQVFIDGAQAEPVLRWLVEPVLRWLVRTADGSRDARPTVT